MTPNLPLPTEVEKLKASTVMWIVTPPCCLQNAQPALLSVYGCRECIVTFANFHPPPL